MSLSNKLLRHVDALIRHMDAFDNMLARLQVNINRPPQIGKLAKKAGVLELSDESIFAALCALKASAEDQANQKNRKGSGSCEAGAR